MLRSSCTMTHINIATHYERIQALNWPSSSALDAVRVSCFSESSRWTQFLENMQQTISGPKMATHGSAMASCSAGTGSADGSVTSCSRLARKTGDGERVLGGAGVSSRCLSSSLIKKEHTSSCCYWYIHGYVESYETNRNWERLSNVRLDVEEWLQ